MTFQVKVHKDVLSGMELLPPVVQGEMVRSLSAMASGGHTHIEPASVAYINDSEFNIYAYENKEKMFMQDGISLKCYFSAVNDGEYYITQITDIINGNNALTNNWVGFDGTLGSTPFEFDDINKKDFSVLDGDWFDWHSDLATALQCPYESDPILKLQRLFYTNLAEIDKKHLIRIGLKTPKLAFPNPAIGIRSFPVDKITASHKNHTDNDPLFVSHRIGIRINDPSALVVVNWVDESEPYSWVNTELMIMICNMMKEIYPNLRIKILEIVIRDSAGNDVYSKEYSKWQNVFDVENTKTGTVGVIGCLLDEGNNNREKSSLIHVKFGLAELCSQYSAAIKRDDPSLVSISNGQYKETLDLAVKNCLYLARKVALEPSKCN